MKRLILWGATFGLAFAVGIGLAGLFAEQTEAMYCDVYSQHDTYGDCGSCSSHGHIGILKTTWMGYMIDPGTWQYYDCGPIAYHCVDCIDVVPTIPPEEP